MYCESCGRNCNCEKEFEIGDIIYRNVRGFTLTGCVNCRIIDLRDNNGEKEARLEIASDRDKQDHQLVKMLAEPNCWHKLKFGWEHA